MANHHDYPLLFNLPNNFLNETKKRKREENLKNWKWSDVIVIDDVDVPHVDVKHEVVEPCDVDVKHEFNEPFDVDVPHVDIVDVDVPHVDVSNEVAEHHVQNSYPYNLSFIIYFCIYLSHIQLSKVYIYT